MTQTTQAPATENFEALLEEFMHQQKTLEGKVVRGKIVKIMRDFAIIDVGLKSEGKVLLKELSGRAQAQIPAIGDEVDVFVERMEDRNGDAVLSVEKARREASWTSLEKACEEETYVNGIIFGRVKGGFAVDLDGAIAFLPGSQVDIRPIKDPSPIMNITQPFKVLKMDKARNNIVVSRRAVMEDSRSEAKKDLVDNLAEGQVLSGVVKNITDYGAFIDLGGVDGLLHVTDISWKRINHPSEHLTLGATIDVQVIRYNAETQRISLGMKQLADDPWKDIGNKYQVGEKVKGKVSNITDYGAFVELEPSIEGLIYVTELSWTKKNLHPSKVVELGQEVEVSVLEVDPEKRRISLGLKQCLANPWQRIIEEHPVGSTIEGIIKNVTEFGLFVGVNNDIDGMVHMNDIVWDGSPDEAIKRYNKGDKITAKILNIDPEKERISLGVKQLGDDPFAHALQSIKKGDTVTCTVKAVTPRDIEVETASGLMGTIKKADLSRDRSEQRTDRFAVGEKIDAKVLQVSDMSRTIALSIKALEIEEEKKALTEFGSSDSGATLGDILGSAMGESSTTSKEEKKPSKKATATKEEKVATPKKKTAAPKEEGEEKTKSKSEDTAAAE